MKKAMILGLVMLTLLVGGIALAEGPVLMVDLPEDALMIENFEFEDGDFIQTHQLAGGATVQILRYGAFDMTLEDLAEGEWTGYASAEKMQISQIDGCPAEGLHIEYVQSGEIGETAFEVYTIMIEAQAQKLIFQAVFPKSMGDAQIEATMQGWLESMKIEGANTEDVG